MCYNPAPVVKLVDTPDLGSGALRRVGSSPIRRTKNKRNLIELIRFLLFFYREKAGMRLLFRQPSHPTESPVTLSSKNHHHQKKNSSQSFLKIIRMKFSAPESQEKDRQSNLFLQTVCRSVRICFLLLNYRGKTLPVCTLPS